MLDVGINKDGDDICGDVDPLVESVARIYTPVPGGIGPITVGMVGRNLFECWKNQNLEAIQAIFKKKISANLYEANEKEFTPVPIKEERRVILQDKLDEDPSKPESKDSGVSGAKQDITENIFFAYNRQNEDKPQK